VVQVAAGNGHSLALRSDGTVSAWGDNRRGQLGDGTLTSHSTPERVTGLPVYIAGISASGRFTARLGDGISATGGFATVLGTDGTVWAWGDDSAGQLGNARSSIPVTRPVNTIGAGSAITQLSAGAFHVLALKSNGTALAWGSNGSGQLGNGTTTDPAGPVQVTGLANATQVAAGGQFSLAVHTVLGLVGS
jgi:alpha-tubulin suppressor-like RCC1 family protein